MRGTNIQKQGWPPFVLPDMSCKVNRRRTVTLLEVFTATAAMSPVGLLTSQEDLTASTFRQPIEYCLPNHRDNDKFLGLEVRRIM